MKISTLRTQEVIDIVSGCRLGYVNDLDIDFESGYILALVVAESGKFISLFAKDDELVIPWQNIRKIGTDVILVETEYVG